MKKSTCFLAGFLTVAVAIGLIRGRSPPQGELPSKIESKAPEAKVSVESQSESLLEQVRVLQASLESSAANLEQAKNQVRVQNDLVNDIAELEAAQDAGKIDPQEYLRRRRDIGERVLR